MERSPLVHAIQDVVRAVRQKKPVAEVINLILDRACTLANAVHGSFVEIHKETGDLHIVATAGPDWTPEKISCRMRIGEGITGTVARTGTPYLCRDTRQDPLYFPLFDYVRSELAVPVVVGDRIWGIINLDGLSTDSFDEETVATITILADLAAAAISLRQEMEQQQRLQQELLQTEKLASLGKVIAGIAHEINNPLTAILGHASLLGMRRGGLADEKSVQAIVAESQRVASLVKDLLAFSRKKTKGPLICGINDVVNQTCSIIRYEMKLKGTRLDTLLPPTSYPVPIDAQQFQQVLLNLINNAQQAIPDTHPEPLVRVEVERSGEKVITRVIDNGTGIPEDVASRIFDPFFTTKPVGQGTGLGLSIAHTIIDACGGNLSFTSQPGAGTTFQIELPLAHLPEEVISVPPADPAPTPSAQASNRIRILVIEDEALLLNALLQFLDGDAFEVDCAVEGTSAMAKLRAASYDVVLSDIRVPGRTGLQIYHDIVHDHPAYLRKFVFMSGDLVRDTTREEVRATGCLCLEKPFPFDLLRETLLQVGAQSHNRAAA
jgi:signal transduction histidine kinase/ActR/RegA family two-component response regulator